MRDRVLAGSVLVLASAAVFVACGTPAPPQLPSIVLDSGAPPTLDAAATSPPAPSDKLACAATAEWSGDASLAPRDFTATERAAFDDNEALLARAPRPELEFIRGRQHHAAHHWAEAAVIFRALALGPKPSDPRALFAAQAAAELYLDALVVLVGHGAPACRADLTRDVSALEAAWCPTPIALCEKLPRIDLELGRAEAQTLPPAEAAPRFEALFDRHCAPTKRPLETHCVELLYNAAVSHRAAGDLSHARAVLAKMRDPKYGLQRDPLARRLDCVLSADAGACP